MPSEPWAPAAFEERYRRSPDPWDFTTSDYEQGRYRAILDALPAERYRYGYEPGCSIGELTWHLAQRCDGLRAIDVSETAVAWARERCGALTGVTIEVGSVDRDRARDHDLVVFSEVGYYFTPPQLDAVLERLVDAMVPGADLVACHWLGHSEDHRLHGRTVHEHIAAHDGLVPGPAGQVDHDGFVIGTWRRP